MNVSKPSAALMTIFCCDAPITEGNHRLSLVSISKNTTSCSDINFSRRPTSSSIFATSCMMRKIFVLSRTFFLQILRATILFCYSKTHSDWLSVFKAYTAPVMLLGMVMLLELVTLLRLVTWLRKKLRPVPPFCRATIPFNNFT